MRLRTVLGHAVIQLTMLASLRVETALASAPRKPAPAKDDPIALAHAQYLEALTTGSAKYVAKDVAGALEQFQKATQLEPRNPMGYYLLGEAQLGSNDLPEAETAWLHASQVSDEGPPGLKAKIFFVIADLRERQKRWDDAKAAWEQYTELTSKLADGTAFPQVGTERIAMIDAMVKQDKAYEVVRKRIKEENDKKAAGQPVR